MHGQGAQRVDLLGHFHRANLRAHRGANPPGDHKSRENRPQLAEHRQRDHRTDRGFHVQARKLKISLRGKDRPGERPGDDHDELRPIANFRNLEKRQLEDGCAPQRSSKTSPRQGEQPGRDK